MADFVMKKKKAFTFALEDHPGHTYEIPALSSLSFEDARILTEADKEQDLVQRGKIIREFILKFAPDLKSLSDMEFFEIYNAYALFVGHAQMGESQASQDS